MARYVIELRKEMTITAIADLTGLNWKTVKNIEKRYLHKRYRKIRLKDVTAIGIDEIHLGKKMGYKTIVIDLHTGSVLHVGKGRDNDALKDFTRKLKSSSCRITAVAVDMAPAYTKWVNNNLPAATIVYDHFHVIKLMNDKLDQVRRSEVNKARKLDNEQERKLDDYCNRLMVRALNRGIDRQAIDQRIRKLKSQLSPLAADIKGTKWILLGNEEKVRTNKDAEKALDHLQHSNANLATAYQLKEQLRDIYRIDHKEEAEIQLERWCLLAEATKLAPLRTMVRTIRSHSAGILAYWNQGITSAKVEGFNNKIRWLIRQAYGYRDEEYVELKIFHLPEISTTKKL